MKTKISQTIDQLASQPQSQQMVELLKGIQETLHQSHFCPDGRPHYWGFWNFLIESPTCKRCGHYEWTRNY